MLVAVTLCDPIRHGACLSALKLVVLRHYTRTIITLYYITLHFIYRSRRVCSCFHTTNISINVDGTVIKPVDCIRDIGVHMDRYGGKALKKILNRVIYKKEIFTIHPLEQVDHTSRFKRFERVSQRSHRVLSGSTIVPVCRIPS